MDKYILGKIEDLNVKTTINITPSSALLDKKDKRIKELEDALKDCESLFQFRDFDTPLYLKVKQALSPSSEEKGNNNE
jgi:hypothetical protein